MSAFEPQPGDERLTAAILSDSLDEEGFRAQVLEPGLLPLATGSRALGRAATVRFAADETDPGDDPYRAAIRFIDGLASGELVIAATGESRVSAVWGELFSAAALGTGVTGVVTDGALRDTDRIVALGFPAFAPARRPVDYRRRQAIAETRGRVELRGVAIEDGDLVMADDDGVVVVPRRAEAAVLARARERMARESTVLTELLAGETLGAVWARHGIL